MSRNITSKWWSWDLNRGCQGLHLKYLPPRTMNRVVKAMTTTTFSSPNDTVQALVTWQPLVRITETTAVEEITKSHYMSLYGFRGLHRRM